MPEPAQLRLLWPVLGAMALLLTAGVAALLHLVSRRPVRSTPWDVLLAQLAAASPWRGRDVLAIVLLASGALAARSFLGPSTALDVLALSGTTFAAALAFASGKPHPFGGPAPWRAVAAQGLLRFLAILPVLWFAACAWQIAHRLTGRAPDLQRAVQLFIDADSFSARAGFCFFAIVLAPLAEETFFRGILLPVLVRQMGAWVGIAMTAAGFAALHANTGSFASLAIFSVALSLAYVRTGTLWVPILMHALFNAASLALLLGLVRAGLAG